MKGFEAGLRSLYGRRFRGAYVFGSYARGEQDPESDVDVMVVLDDILRYGAEVDRTSVLTSDLSLRFGVSISRVFVSDADWRKGATRFLLEARGEAIPA
jgi:predicted nucleotidyltransferase